MLIADDRESYLSANEASAKLFGFSVEELLKMNVENLITITYPSAKERYEEYCFENSQRNA